MMHAESPLVHGLNLKTSNGICGFMKKAAAAKMKLAAR